MFTEASCGTPETAELQLAPGRRGVWLAGAGAGAVGDGVAGAASPIAADRAVSVSFVTGADGAAAALRSAAR